jgi:riboflavin synthase
MFTGLVETTGILRRRAGRPVARAFIEAALGPLTLGESISVHGACLTVDSILEGGFECDMSSETLGRTTLGALPLGSRVHLERATPLGGRMGGHIVLGHVDGIGRVSARDPRGEAIRFEVKAPAELDRYLAPKGSVCLNGVSLTINAVGAGSPDGVPFDVMLVPHTLGRTLLGDAGPGAQVNIEVDVLARYVARQLSWHGAAGAPAGDAAREEEHGANADDDERILAKLRAGGFL